MFDKLIFNEAIDAIQRFTSMVARRCTECGTRFVGRDNHVFRRLEVSFDEHMGTHHRKAVSDE